MLQEVSTGAYYPPVVTAGRFLLPEHPTGQRGHCAMGADYLHLCRYLHFSRFTLQT